MNELGTHQTHIRSTRIASSSFFLFCINTGTETTSLFGQANSHGPFSLCHWGCLDWVLEVKTRAKEKRIPQCVRVKDSAVGHLSFCLFGSVYFFFFFSDGGGAGVSSDARTFGRCHAIKAGRRHCKSSCRRDL